MPCGTHEQGQRLSAFINKCCGAEPGKGALRGANPRIVSPGALCIIWGWEKPGGRRECAPDDRAACPSILRPKTVGTALMRLCSPSEMHPTGKSAPVHKTCLAPSAKIFRFRRRANQIYQLAPSFPGKRDASRSSRTRDEMRWTRQRWRANGIAGQALPVSEEPARGRTALQRLRQNSADSTWFVESCGGGRCVRRSRVVLASSRFFDLWKTAETPENEGIFGLCWISGRRARNPSGPDRP
jgi:hypothetical protein